MTDDRRATGRRVRREVLGDQHVDRAEAATTPFTAAFQDFITRTAWGDVWARPGLDRRTRSAITLAMLAALRAEGEMALHVRAAIRNGLTEAELSEILLQVAVYAGVPAANAAFVIAAKALADAGIEAGSSADAPAGADDSPPAEHGSPPAEHFSSPAARPPQGPIDSATTGRKEHAR